jgi:serine protease
MSLSRRVLPAVVMAAWLLPGFAAGTADAGSARVIVKYRADSALVQAQAAAGALPQHGDTMGKRLGLVLADGRVLGPRTQSLRARGIASQALASRLARQPDVEWAVPAYRRTINATVPNDPFYGPNQRTITPAAGQWYLRAPDATLVAAINAVGAWATTTGSASITVADLDTGVTSHPDLAGKLRPGYDFVSPDAPGDFTTAGDGNGRDADASDPGDWSSACSSPASSWHGTETAGIIAAASDNGIGIAGTGRDVMLLPVRVLGKCGGFDDDIIAGMRWAAGLDATPANPHPAQVLNMSLGSPDACTSAYVDAIAELNGHGVTVVVAAGNENGTAVGAPANCPGALSVAGIRHTGTKVGYSNVGPENFIAAPGGNCVNAIGDCQYPIMSTSNTGITTPASPKYTSGGNDRTLGTSFSSPQVAGVIALMLSADPTLTPARIRTVLKATARPFPTSSTVAACRPPSATEQDECYCTTGTCGAGMLDAAAAVAAVASGGLVPPTVTIAASTTAPAANSNVALDSSGSSADGGRTITGWSWSVTGGAARASLVGSTTGPTASLRVTAVGDLTVQLVATDSAGAASTSSVTLYAQASQGGGSDGGGGGGALSTFWVTLLALAVFVLWRQRRRPPDRG